MQLLSTFLLASAFAGSVYAHPGHDHEAEIAERAAFTKHSKKDLSHCAAKFKARGLEQRSIARRSAAAKQARQKRGLDTNAPYLRARADPVDTDHESSVQYNSETSSDTLFASNGSCILSPEVTQGPYYVTGEYVREDVREKQSGVELMLDTQVVDVTTCDPVTNAVIEIWHCNSTGVYSGVVASGNGVGSSDPTNLNNTFLRGLQPTDEDGVAKFTTLFPGHYSGRATHIHVMVHFNGTQFDNGTYAGGYVSHVGQLFFDQSLISSVSKVSPYSGNNAAITANSEDNILSEETGNGHDPLVEYSLLSTSDDVSEGIFGWISFGVDLTSQETVTGASTLTSNGGVANSGSGMGGGGPGGSGGSGGGPSSGSSNGTFGGGVRPSGSGSVPADATGMPGSGSTNGTAPGVVVNGTTVGAGGTRPSASGTIVGGSASTDSAGATGVVSSTTLAAGAQGSGVVSMGLLVVLAFFGML